jgi:hypothetical protein
MGVMRVLSSEGDSEISWDPDSDKSIANAKAKFKKYLGKGYKAFRLDGKGNKRGRAILDFPPHAAELLFIPPIVGG